METDHIFFHELHKKRRSQLVDVIIHSDSDPRAFVRDHKAVTE